MRWRPNSGECWHFASNDPVGAGPFSGAGSHSSPPGGAASIATIQFCLRLWPYLVICDGPSSNGRRCPCSRRSVHNGPAIGPWIALCRGEETRNRPTRFGAAFSNLVLSTAPPPDPVDLAGAGSKFESSRARIPSFARGLFPLVGSIQLAKRCDSSTTKCQLVSVIGLPPN